MGMPQQLFSTLEVKDSVSDGRRRPKEENGNVEPSNILKQQLSLITETQLSPPELRNTNPHLEQEEHGPGH